MRKFVLIIILLFCAKNHAMELEKELSLEGEWRFEIGDREEYASPNYNDEQWEKIVVPDSWENEGFPGYDGFAWYRIRFSISRELKNKVLYVKLGRIDDVDMVYLNGHYIGGMGQLPPDYKSAFDNNRVYKIPRVALKYGGENIISVRVYDKQGVGGIYTGDVGLYSRIDVVKLVLDLTGLWWFKHGDSLTWKDPNFDESAWDVIKVPAYWEDQGYPNLDGIAWYRKRFKIDQKYADEKLILLLGKVNDIDQVYFNGHLIGLTGRFPQDGKPATIENMKKELRAYFVPPDFIRKEGENVIAVRVYDAGHNGGIYKEYVGLVTRKEYLKYMKTVR